MRSPNGGGLSLRTDNYVERQPIRPVDALARSNGTEIFFERDCAVGGCACPCWADWHQARREYALAHQRADDLDAIVDDTAYSEALDELAERLDGEFRHPAPTCARPGCAYHRPGAA